MSKPKTDSIKHISMNWESNRRRGARKTFQ